MANRVSGDEVRAIIDTDIEVGIFITSANALINDALSTEISGGDVSSTILKQMELWLSAHFVAIREQVPKSEKIGDGTFTYYGEGGKGLESTPYGQQALALDPTGKLAGVRGKPSKLEVLL